MKIGDYQISDLPSSKTYLLPNWKIVIEHDVNPQEYRDGWTAIIYKIEEGKEEQAVAHLVNLKSFDIAKQFAENYLSEKSVRDAVRDLEKQVAISNNMKWVSDSPVHTFDDYGNILYWDEATKSMVMSRELKSGFAVSPRLHPPGAQKDWKWINAIHVAIADGNATVQEEPPTRELVTHPPYPDETDDDAFARSVREALGLGDPTNGK